MKGQGEEYDRRHFPLSSGERPKVYKFSIISPCIVFSFIRLLNMGTGAKGDWDFRISDLVRNLDGTDI